jgi:DNA polymerase I-like protein with 3'-5' exonuclease and polymerase domains
VNPIQAYHLLHQGTLALQEAEQAGIRVDMDYLTNKITELETRIDNLDYEFRTSKFYQQWESIQDKEPNPNSTVQLSNFLYNVKGIRPPKLTPKEKGSVDKETLASLNIPELDMILESRKLKKIKDYLLGFEREQVDGWLHPSFNLHLVRTYRSSSDRPNFQNIPKRDKEAMEITRRALYPRSGHQLLEVDYGALEVRIAACYHKDPTMIKYIKTGYDLHTDMTKQIFILDEYDDSIPGHTHLRGSVKNGFVFPQFYGDYWRNCAKYMACDWGELPSGRRWKAGDGVQVQDNTTLASHLGQRGIASLTAFEEHVKEIEEDFWGRRFRHYAQWKERWWREYQKTGHIDMLTGFRCKGVMGRNDAINYPIQGSAFHCLLWSFIKVHEFLQRYQWRTRIIGQIHDAIVLDVYPPELPQLVKHIVTITTIDLPKAWDWIIVPLEVDFEVCDVDASWADKKKLVLEEI